MRYVVIFPVLALYVYIRALIPLALGRRKLICAALLLPGATSCIHNEVCRGIHGGSRVTKTRHDCG